MNALRSTPARRVKGLSISLTALLLSTGCVLHTPHIDSVAHEIERELPATHLEAQASFKLGRISLGLAKSITRLVLDEEEEREVFATFRGLKRVELGVFEAHGKGLETTGFPNRLETSMHKNGWETLARFRDDHAMAWILYRLESPNMRGIGRLRNLLVLALDEEELVIVRLSGRLDRVVSAALAYASSTIEQDRKSSEEPLRRDPTIAGF